MILRVRQHTARKTFTCDECDQPIHPGDTYYGTAAICEFTGRFVYYHTHIQPNDPKYVTCGEERYEDDDVEVDNPRVIT